MLHWFWFGFFALFGLVLLWKPRFLAADCSRAGLPRVGDQQERAVQALQRRTEAEHISAIPGYVGGVGSLVLAAISALTTIRPILFYALFSLWVSAIIAVMFIQLRNVQPKRVAVLSPRSFSAVIPPWLAVCAVLSAFSVLVYVPYPQLTAVSAIVCCSALATFAVAWRLTQLPALLQGEDLAAEVFIDNRLRIQRSAGPLILSVVQPFAFASLVVQTNGVERGATIFSLAIFFLVALWSLRSLYKPGSFAAV